MKVALSYLYLREYGIYERSRTLVLVKLTAIPAAAVKLGGAVGLLHSYTFNA